MRAGSNGSATTRCGSASDSATGSASPSASPSARTSPSPTRGPTTEPGTKKTKKATKKARKRTAPALTKVPASPPHAISIGRAIANAPFGNALSPTSGRLIPDAVDELQRLGDRGIPGSPGTDTVVLVGASSTSGRGALDGIDDVRTGAQIVLETQNARLTYKITSATDVDADQVLTLPAVTEKHTDRLVIDCAHYDDAHRVGSDRVLVATLVKAESMRP